jgi:hypothetical protein
MAMWFDAKAALAAIEGAGARPVAPSPGANRANRANPPAADPPRLAQIARLAPPDSAAPPSAPHARPQKDAAALADALRFHGPMTQGAAALVLGWGATRAWRAEAQLRAARTVQIDGWGRAVIKGPHGR